MELPDRCAGILLVLVILHSLSSCEVSSQGMTSFDNYAMKIKIFKVCICKNIYRDITYPTACIFKSYFI